MISISIKHILILSILLRVSFFLFGLYQDAYMTVKYTDIDYLVFTDAAKYVYDGESPYVRETYRYTPLLSWMLLPTAWGGYWYNFGKFLFMTSDIVTGFLILRMLEFDTKSLKKVFILSSIWLLNPMVITISTRGSSESVLTVMIMFSLYFLFHNSIVFSAIWMGLSIHFKIYPIIYLPSILLFLAKTDKPICRYPVVNWVNKANLKYLLVTIITTGLLNALMYSIYGYDFLYHSYLYHLIRIDHRHNFSVYNIALYYKSTLPDQIGKSMSIESYALIPQMLVSSVLMPLLFARKNLISTFFLQTYTFVTFNKVMTSQYFIWFLIFLPHLLSSSKLITNQGCARGIFALVLWVVSQGTWLYFAYNLEFIGISTFDSGLLYSSIFFFLSNCWILGILIDDLSSK